MSPGHVEFDQYDIFLREVKDRIATARVRAALAVNAELVALYWQIGRMILDRQERHGWGGKVIERLAGDLRTEFPGTRGFSGRNLRYLRTFAASHSTPEFGQQLVAQIPWGHITVLLDKVTDTAVRVWYAEQTTANGWSRNVLAHQIKTQLHERQGNAISNFDRTLPAPQSDLVREALKSTYNFEFLGLDERVSERTLEEALVERIQRFLLELGSGFAFVGRQHRLVVGGDEFFIDMLFYHLRLRCYVVVELKTRAFTPEDIGKVAFYRAAIDGELRHPDDQPTIGLVLCTDHNETVVEYALQDIAAPVAVSAWIHRRSWMRGVRAPSQAGAGEHPQGEPFGLTPNPHGDGDPGASAPRDAVDPGSEYAHALPSPDELRTAIDEGRRAYLQGTGA